MAKSEVLELSIILFRVERVKVLSLATHHNQDLVRGTHAADLVFSPSVCLTEVYVLRCWSPCRLVIYVVKPGTRQCKLFLDQKPHQILMQMILGLMLFFFLAFTMLLCFWVGECREGQVPLFSDLMRHTSDYYPTGHFILR